MATDVVRAVLDALERSAPEALKDEIARRSPTSEAPGSGPKADGMDPILRRLTLDDILGDDILGARPGDRAFPLRALFGKLAQSLESDAGFAFASGMSFYFRSELDDEVRMQLGVAISTLFYDFAEHAAIERAEIANVAPLLATLLSSQLERVVLESVDHTRTFDSTLHERDAASGSGAAIIPRSFLSKVKATGMVRSKALVRSS